MSNRVEELESRVAELQAAVDGLTEELVETRERLRALESDADASAGGSRNETVTPDGTEDPDDAADDDAVTAAAETDATDDAAPADSEAPAEAAADAEPAEGSTSDSNSDSDDIIVA